MNIISRLLTVVTFRGIYKLTYKRFGALIIGGINYATSMPRALHRNECV